MAITTLESSTQDLKINQIYSWKTPELELEIFKYKETMFSRKNQGQHDRIEIETTKKNHSKIY